MCELAEARTTGEGAPEGEAKGKGGMLVGELGAVTVVVYVLPLLLVCLLRGESTREIADC